MHATVYKIMCFLICLLSGNDVLADTVLVAANEGEIGEQCGELCILDKD